MRLTKELLAAIVVFVLAGCRPAPPPAPARPRSPVTVAPPFDSRKGYWHKESGTSFLYPPGWSRDEPVVEDGETHIGLSKKGFVVTLFWTPLQELVTTPSLANEEYENLKGMYGSVVGRPKLRKIAGMDGFEISIDAGPGGKQAGGMTGIDYIFLPGDGIHQWYVELRASVVGKEKLAEVEKLLANFRRQ